jgi:hypothetical protein
LNSRTKLCTPRDNYFVGVIAILVFSFVCGLFAYGPVALIEINFFIFEDLSISKVVGDWDNVTKYCLSTIFCFITGFSYHLCVKVWKLPIIVSVPSAFLMSILGLVIFAAAIVMLLSILAMIIGLLALFFGPGDR